MATIALIGTCDTKLEEVLFLREEIIKGSSDINVTLIDVGARTTKHNSINHHVNYFTSTSDASARKETNTRGEVLSEISANAKKLVQKLFNEGSIHGIIAAGGSGGTSIAATVMREALPIGIPKFIVSTVASGDTGPIVGETDITLMYSVVDISGLNQLLRTVLRNAAAAITGMAKSYASNSKISESRTKKRVGITMFGVTTPAVDVIRSHLEQNYDIEVYVFHATGHGGKAMERLVREGGLDAVLDLTTTEICDLLTGGVMSAGPKRLEAAAETGMPYIVSVGATDMSNFGPRSTVPEKYKDRKLYEHNAVVTLMRSSEEESRKVGEFIADKLKRYTKAPNKVQVWLPEGGVSVISIPGGPFDDQKANDALFSAVMSGLDDSKIDVITDKRAINDAGFAKDIAEALVYKMGLSRS
ncbi:UPF0261 domain-containing protein [Aaosphaeria arxii CBS 175.79]|uniref:UPF0261 domain-containing protein n=1 Tax=Aaosphaeria arxii CBS 175.79 TaxID=1450172 RepID=A0A6A5Y838_9PLEO|nr:UPF0261 domain-containing protein [Aaosphaeria arxii CBS 175.79]KAF2021476.1 UPF0261 domain-containing protein [Aaosphaeria arxii CBS 175.79]